MKATAKFLVVFLLLYPLGVLCHEVVGHGGAAMLVGGRITYVHILGFDWWPDLKWIGWQGVYGMCDADGVAGPLRQAWMILGGSLSTWFVAAIATALLNVRHWGPRPRLLLACLSLWWIDLLTYTLPSWGIKRSIFWGQNHFAEPLVGAVALGVPAWLFQTLAIASSAAMLALLIAHGARHELRSLSSERSAAG